MSKTPRERRRAPQRLDRTFEGPEALGALLADSGCALTVEEVIEEFICAVEEGSPAGEIIGLLWEVEPKFPTPAVARRTFGNLFGLWDAVVAEQRDPGLVELSTLDPDAPLSAAAVDRAWRALDDLDPRDWQRAQDRFDNCQSDIGPFVFGRLSDQAPVAISTALELAFETWWILEHHRGPDAVRATALTWLNDMADDADPGPEPEPALAGMATTALWEQAADEAQPLPETAIPLIERALFTIRRALTA